MRKMIDSGVEWLGAIPQDWDLVQIKSIASCKSEKSSYIGGAYIGLEHIESGSGKLLADGSQTGIEVDSTVSSFSDTDILFGKLRPYLAKAAKPNFDGQCSTEILVLNPSSLIQKDFLFWYLLNPAFIDAVNASTYGAKMPRANWNFIGSCYLPLPPMNMQTVISSVLNEKFAQVDTLIANVQAQIEKLKAYKQSVITEVVTKGLDHTVPMKESGIEWIGQIPEHWDMTRKLAFVTTDGISYGIVKLHDPDDVNGVKVLRCSDVLEGFIKPDNIRTVAREVSNEYARTILAGGEVLVNVRGSLGGCSVVPEEMAGYNIAREVAKITLNSRMCNRYVMYYLLSRCFVEYRTSHLSGSVYVGLNIELLSSCPLSNPELTEQKAMADYLDKKCSQIDHLIAIKQAKIEKLEQYKQSLIYEYVTGKREVM